MNGVGSKLLPATKEENRFIGQKDEPFQALLRSLKDTLAQGFRIKSKLHADTAHLPKEEEEEA